jgi:light-regulated signal transduction histidine kinase (bacteriophytochrome)
MQIYLRKRREGPTTESARDEYQRSGQRLQRLIDDTTAFCLADGSLRDMSLVNIEEALQFAPSNLKTAIDESYSDITSDWLPAIASLLEAWP